MSEPEAEEVVEVQAKGTVTGKAIVTFWKDESMTLCVEKATTIDHTFTEAGCYDIDPSPHNRQLFQMLKAFYASLGLEVKPLTEGEG